MHRFVCFLKQGVYLLHEDSISASPVQLGEKSSEVGRFLESPHSCFYLSIINFSFEGKNAIFSCIKDYSIASKATTLKPLSKST